jgi:hypothetical protein
MCGSEELPVDTDGLDDALYVIINSIFVPECPNLDADVARLTGGSNSTAISADVAPAPAPAPAGSGAAGRAILPMLLLALTALLL